MTLPSQTKGQAVLLALFVTLARRRSILICSATQIFPLTLRGGEAGYKQTNKPLTGMTTNMVPTRNEVGMVLLRDVVMVLGVLEDTGTVLMLPEFPLPLP